MDIKAKRDRSGIVINPNHSICFVVHEIPNTHGDELSGIMP